MPRSAEIHSQIDRYRLDVNGFTVRPIYWIHTPDFSPHGFRAGKGTPEEMQGEVDRIVARCDAAGEEMNVTNPASARDLLRRNMIGSDCSAFVFHVADGMVSRNTGLSLQDTIYVPKAQVIKDAQKESWQEVHELSVAESEALPDMVPVGWITNNYKKDPAFVVNVARLANDASSDPVASIEAVAPGDLIIMGKNGKNKHVVMVTDVNGPELVVWDSYREDAGLGGVMPHEVTLVDKNAPIQEQRWENFKTERYDRYELRRLKVFSQDQ